MKGKMALGYFEGCVEGIEVTKRKKLLNEIRLRRCDGTQSIVVHSKEQWQELKKLGDEAFGVSDWVSVETQRPPKNDKWYPIRDSDGHGVFIQGKVINEDYESYSEELGCCCIITHWLDCPLPEPKQEG